MFFSCRNILNCFVLSAAVLCCAGSAWALDIEWGAPGFGGPADGSAAYAPAPPESEAQLEGSGLENGFRGVTWGTTKEDMEDTLHMEFIQCLEMPGNRLNCALSGANRSIRDIPLLLLRYKFLHEIFYGISLKYKAKYEKDMYAIFKEVLGPPTGYRESFPVWHGRTFEAWATDTHFSFSSKKVLKKKRHGGGTF